MLLGATNTEAAEPDTTVRVNNAFMLQAGSAHRADTYLTPLHYSGWAVKGAYSHTRAMSRHPFFWTLDIDLTFDRTLNPVRNSEMLGAQFEASWRMLWRHSLGHNIEAGAGGATHLQAGALYLRRNGNNPVAANASWTLGAAAYAAWHFRLGRMPATAIYNGSLPLVGAMFAPDYGQLYYEIYMGDRKGLAAAAFPGRYFRYNQQLYLDLKIGPKYLRLGYGLDVASSKVKGIVSRRIDHMFILGLTTDWLTPIR